MMKSYFWTILPDVTLAEVQNVYAKLYGAKSPHLMVKNMNEFSIKKKKQDAPCLFVRRLKQSFRGILSWGVASLGVWIGTFYLKLVHIFFQF